MVELVHRAVTVAFGNYICCIMVVMHDKTGTEGMALVLRGTVWKCQALLHSPAAAMAQLAGIEPGNSATPSTRRSR